MTRIALAGDVMIGRGIDQIMRRSVSPELYESWARSALRYVELAEARSGPLPRGVDLSYVWGDTPTQLADAAVDVRIVNLETSLTSRGKPWPGKGIHYRAHPENAETLVAAGIDVVTMANNHVLDWSEQGLEDTVDTLVELGVGHTGAGRGREEAWQPESVRTGTGRVVVLGVGTPSSGIDPSWAARPGKPGVALIDRFSRRCIDEIGRALTGRRRDGDVTVVSIHWGSNWGYGVPEAHRRFAHDLIDEIGVDLVHGHSSHHPLGFEVYRGRLILYGCGDLITDYEGIQGHEEFRPELGAWYLVDIEARGGLQGLSLLPTRMHRFRLETPGREEMAWLAQLLERESRPPVRVHPEEGLLAVEW
ncbi:MAG: CapA family protein [Actinomycetota bacterium]